MTLLLVLKTNPETTQTISNETDPDNTTSVWASCLALLTPKYHDLALLIQRWDALPEQIKAGIMAIVNTTTTHSMYWYVPRAGKRHARDTCVSAP